MEVNVTNITSSVEIEAGYDLYEIVIFEGSEDNARQYAIQAALSASESLEYSELAEADKVQTGLDRIATAADRVQTGLDVIATGDDRTQTGLDRTQTGLDRTQTGLDRIATGADRVQTGLDVISSGTNASNAQLAADSINAVLIQNLGSISGNVSINLNLGTLIKATLTGAVTLSFTGLPSATSEKGFTLRFSGLQMIVFPVGTLFASGDAPTPAGTLYDIPCSISSAGVIIVYGSINTIEI